MVSQTLGCESCMAHTNLKCCIQVLLPCPFTGTALEICAGVYWLQGVKANVGNQHWNVLEGVCTLGDAVAPSKTLGNPLALFLEQLSLYGALCPSHNCVRRWVNVLLREYFGNIQG